VSISIAIGQPVRHISILPICVVTVTAVDEAVAISVVVAVLRAQPVVLLHRHGCLPASVVFCMDSRCQVDGKRNDVECENERYGPFKYGCSITDFPKVANGKCC
jgi:hypothetical protein